MAIVTAGDLIFFALRNAGVTGAGQTPAPEDTTDCMSMLNMLLAEWQLNRWLIYDLVEASITSTGAASYTVGSTGAFALSFAASQRPDRIDSAYARLTATGAATQLWPFMAREGFDRITATTSTSTVPESYFYDAQAGANGLVYFYPIPPATYTLAVSAKAPLPQFVNLTDIIALPLQYKTAMLWNLSAAIRPLYGLPDDPATTQRAAQSLLSIGGSGAQEAQAQQVPPSSRSGVFSHVAPQQAPDPKS